MRKIRELSLFLIGIALFCLGWLVSIIIELFPKSIENLSSFFGEVFILAKRIFANNLIFEAIVDTYCKAFIPSVILIFVFIVLVLFLKSKPPRKVFYLISFFGSTYLSFAYFLFTRLFGGMPEYLCHSAMTLVIYGSDFTVSIIAGWFCSVFFALFIGTVLTFVCWIFELIYKKGSALCLEKAGK